MATRKIQDTSIVAEKLERNSAEDLSLDSTYFVAFEMTHDALKRGLKAASDLGITPYRMLVKLLGASPDVINQTELGKLLGLKANVVTQAISALEGHGFIQRHKDGSDGRTRTAGITKAGIEQITAVNASIVSQLYSLFPTEDAAYRRILEASIIAGAAIDPPLSHEASGRYPASRTLVSFELIRQATENSLRDACGASYNECRVLQRLGEVDGPLRIGDLANQLRLSAVNVARATDRLARRGWVRRMSAPHDRKAVFVVTTDEGISQQRVITQTVDTMAREQLWSKLGSEHRQAIAQVGHIVIADLQLRKEAERKAALDLLQPIL